jgi:hypothetical protein
VLYKSSVARHVGLEFHSEALLPRTHLYGGGP